MAFSSVPIHWVLLLFVIALEAHLQDFFADKLIYTFDEPSNNIDSILFR